MRSHLGSLPNHEYREEVMQLQRERAMQPWLSWRDDYNRYLLGMFRVLFWRGIERDLGFTASGSDLLPEWSDGVIMPLVLEPKLKPFAVGDPIRPRQRVGAVRNSIGLVRGDEGVIDALDVERHVRMIKFTTDAGSRSASAEWWPVHFFAPLEPAYVPLNLRTISTFEVSTAMLEDDARVMAMFGVRQQMRWHRNPMPPEFER